MCTKHSCRNVIKFIFCIVNSYNVQHQITLELTFTAHFNKNKNIVHHHHHHHHGIERTHKYADVLKIQVNKIKTKQNVQTYRKSIHSFCYCI